MHGLPLYHRYRGIHDIRRIEDPPSREQLCIVAVLRENLFLAGVRASGTVRIPWKRGEERRLGIHDRGPMVFMAILTRNRRPQIITQNMSIHIY